MEINLEILLASRTKLDKIMGDATDGQLFEIPKGFNNNILWHIGHCIVSQQRLMYIRSNLPMHVSNDFNEWFKIGTSPLHWTTKPDVMEVKKSLLETFEKLKEDLKKDMFKTYDPVKSSMGFMINNHLEALSYTNFHEAEHTGNIQFLLKQLANS